MHILILSCFKKANYDAMLRISLKMIKAPAPEYEDLPVAHTIIKSVYFPHVSLL